MWEDHSRSRQELAAAAIAANGHDLVGDSSNSQPPQRSNMVANTFAPEYRELAKLMGDAVSSDNYASSVTLLIPKTAKLRLVSRVKTFFGRLNPKERAAAVELGCLSVLHQWIRVPEQDRDMAASSPNPQVLEAVVGILEALSIRKEDLVEPQVDQPVPSPVHAKQSLPLITAFTSPKRPTRSNGKRKRKREAWSDTVVEYVKAKLYPLYKQKNGAGNLTKERFKAIVKQVADLFSQEAVSMQSALLLPSGDLSNLAKSQCTRRLQAMA
uniref:Uncharacterized protein n=1 Tax=Phytophthora ramorum TaxID=164328 RepID=H3HAN5_PHYRM